MARVLIADDEELERAAMRYIIESSDVEPVCEVDEARNGLEAVAAGLSRKYDVIFLDIRMPGLDGLQTTEELRARGISAPIIIVSAFDAFEYAQKALRLGVYEYLLKPAGSEEVLSALRRSLSSGAADSGELSRRRDASLTAISGAARKLEESLLSQIKAGRLDPETVREFENLCSLTRIPRSVVAFSFDDRGRDSSASPVSRALIASALSSVDRENRKGFSRILSADFANKGVLVLYGEPPATDESGVSSPLSLPKKTAPAGFLRNLKDDPLGRVLDAVSRSMADSAAVCPLFGLAGPAILDTSVLFERALEGVKLASREFLAVRLSAPHSEQNGEEELTRYSSVGSHSRSLGMRAFEAIKTRYSSDFSLKELADELGVNSFHLSHAISRELGIGFNELLNRVRVSKAKDLMLGGGSVKESSYLVGFSDQAYFSRVFKKLEGLTPRSFLGKSAKKYKK